MSEREKASNARERSHRRRRAIGAGFIASFAASIGLCVVYALGGHPQLEGALLGISLGGLAVGLILWGKELMPSSLVVEERELIPHQREERPEAEESFDRGAEAIKRRSFLAKLLGGALAGLGLAALFPIRSLGTRPGRSLFTTPWGEGVRAVDNEGQPITLEDLEVGSVLTVFPEGATDDANAPAMLIRFDQSVDAELPNSERGWTAEGLVAFSKVCTHAGCPVGLYQAETERLFCPCHQSAFAVLQGAVPVSGPATRPLPQLPLGIDDEGFVVATSDFPEPVGPGFWRRPR
ncbi:MAG: Rieske 2Fe-2S domain-containing protein [Actinomycetota bacterium]